MEERPSSHQVLKALASGQALSPQRIASIMDLASQTVRNLLVHLHGLGFVERVDYAQYRITDLGMELYEQLQPSDFPSSRRTE